MVNVNGICKVTKLKDSRSGKSITGTMYWGTKKKDSDNWDNHFFNCVLVGKANTKAIDVNLLDKDKIEITSAILQSRPYQDKDGNAKISYEVIIFDFNFGEEIKQSTTPASQTPANNSNRRGRR
jgi:single-stranded DNA-binding protein